ncbi:MAG: hypothetical protein ACLR5B_11455 [Blautia sp.]
MPIPSFNVINGGRNYGVNQAFNEFIIMPYKAGDIEEAVEIGVQVFQKLENVIEKYTGSQAMVGKSYGWVAPSENPETVLDLIAEAVSLCGYQDKVAFALDCAISDFYDKETGLYYINGRHLTSQELIAYDKRIDRKI